MKIVADEMGGIKVGNIFRNARDGYAFIRMLILNNIYGITCF
jgi:hypothetical protein